MNCFPVRALREKRAAETAHALLKEKIRDLQRDGQAPAYQYTPVPVNDLSSDPTPLPTNRTPRRPCISPSPPTSPAVTTLSPFSPPPPPPRRTSVRTIPRPSAPFDESLRALAEDIVRYHPGLAHLLIGMSATPCPFVHGQN